jgi:hypothetical protein
MNSLRAKVLNQLIEKRRMRRRRSRLEPVMMLVLQR